MNLSLSRVGVSALALATVAAIALMLWLLPRFGGPGLELSDPYTVKATFADAEQIERKSVVLVRGVQVGTVGDIDVRGDRAMVTLDINKRYAPIRRDATVRIGQRTAVGDAFVDLSLGTDAVGELPSGGTIGRVGETVEFDEAFTAFDKPSREAAASTLRSLGRGARDPRSAERWGGTVSGLSRTVEELRGLAGALRGQRGQLARLVTGSRITLRELSNRTRRLNTLVASGRRTFAAIGGQRKRFEQGLQELPLLLSSARRALTQARPLLVEARPFVRDLSAAAPDIRDAFRDAEPTANAARGTLAALPRFTRTAIPFLERALPVVTVARPFARALTPVLQNLVPALDFLSPRAPELAGWFANTGSIGEQRDSKGHWVRFLIFDDPAYSLGAKSASISKNAYPRPGDQTNPMPYTKGSYQRLLPYMPKP